MGCLEHVLDILLVLEQNSSPLDILELVLSCFNVLEWVQAHLTVLEMVLDCFCGSIDGSRSQSSQFESSR